MSKYKLWYSERQRNAETEFLSKYPQFREFLEYMAEEDPPTRALATIPLNGELVEVEYTEMYGGDDPNYTCNWPDAVLLGEFDKAPPIRIERIEEQRNA